MVKYIRNISNIVSSLLSSEYRFVAVNRLMSQLFGKLSLYFTVLLMMFGFGCYQQVKAEYSMDAYRLAVTLSYEIGSAYDEESIKMVASSVMNRLAATRRISKDNSITVTDILYREGSYATYRGGLTGPRTANLNAKALSDIGKAQVGQKYWERALRIANSAVNGTLGDHVRGAYSYHKGNLFTNRGDKSEDLTVRDDRWLYGPNKNVKVNHAFYKYRGGEKYLGALKHKNYNMDPNKGDNDTSSVSTAPNKSEGGAAGADSDGKREAAACTMENMQRMYLTDETKVDQYCWYCKIVIVLVNAYLKAAHDALGATTSLGKVILKFGFMIWLAFYVLKQVSSANAITPGKMAQEILVMGFKVALAYAAVGVGCGVIRDYYLDPIVGTGVDYGLALFDKMVAMHGT